jgi:hypothetical protein
MVHVAIWGLKTVPRTASCPLSPSLPTPLVPGAGLGPTVQAGPCRRLGFRSSITQLLTVRTGPKVGLRSTLFHPFCLPPRRIGPSPRLADTLEYSCCPLVVDVQRAWGPRQEPNRWTPCADCSPRKRSGSVGYLYPCRVALGAPVSPWMSSFAVSGNTTRPITASIRAI